MAIVLRRWATTKLVPVRQEALQGLLDQLFRRRVDTGGCLVEDEDGRVSLAAPSRCLSAAFRAMS